MLRNIVEKPVEMKPFFSDKACSLLTGLLERNPQKRLGGGNGDAEDIKKHEFFEDIDW